MKRPEYKTYTLDAWPPGPAPTARNGRAGPSHDTIRSELAWQELLPP